MLSVMAEKWISAKMALELVEQSVGVYLANKVIAKRANVGLIQAKAKRLIWAKEVKDDTLIPKEFWWAGGEAALEQSWGSGDFSTWLNNTHHLQAFGVCFNRADIEAAAGITIEDSQWVTTKQALTLVEKLCGGSQFGVAGQILEYLRIGHIEAKASAMHLTVHDRYGTNQDGSTNDELTIPEWFWEKCTEQDQCVLDWQSGMFSGKGYINGDTHQAKFIGVKLRASDLKIFEQCDDTEQSVEPANPLETSADKNLPPLSDADLKQWWQSKANVRDSLTKDELLTLVRAKFPGNQISRDRVRDLIGPRKQGPKPFSGKKPAK